LVTFSINFSNSATSDNSKYTLANLNQATLSIFLSFLSTIFPITLDATSETSFLLTSRGAKKNKFYGDISSPVISLSESFSWSKQKLLEKIAVELNLNLETAKDVFARFVENNASRRFLSFIKTILDAEIFSFWQKIFKKTGTEKTILFSSDEILPKSFSVLRQKGKNVSEINIINLAEKFGFSLDFGKKNTKSDNFFFSSLAAFFEYYFSNRDEVLNKLAKRRAKWLIP